MTNQELIQEAAVIRDERNQYANTAERVGTALVHMAEQLAAQAADVDKIEADVRGTLTLSQLDNPFGFTTVAQWMQGLRGDQSYTFRLVAPTGRCIGHVWLFNDYDNPSNSNSAARTLEVVMCCATINAETGRLNYDAINGSPRIYYRSYCVPLTGGTPDGGFLGNGWSAWQEYRDYVAKPIKDALAALQQQHATDVSELQANIDAVDLREGTPTATSVPLVLTKAIKDTVTCNLGPATTARAGVMTVEQVKRLRALREKTDRMRDLGNYSTIGELDNAAAAIVDDSVQMSVGDLPFLMYGTVSYNNTVIYLQTVEDRDEPCIWQMRMYEGGGSGMMQRRLWLDETDFENDILVVTSAEEFTLFIPDGIKVKQDSGEIRLQLEGVYGGAMGGACILNAATTQKAGIMSSVHVQQLADAKAKADKEAGRHYTFDTIYTSFEDFLDTTCEESPEVWTNDSIDYVHSQFLLEGVECPFVVYKINASMNVPDYGELIGAICYVYVDGAILSTHATFILDKTTGTLSYGGHGDIQFPVQTDLRIQQEATQVDIILKGFDEAISANVPLPAATSDKAGVMSAAHVQKLANLESRIAALEAK